MLVRFLSYAEVIYAMNCRAARLALVVQTESGVRAHSRTATESVTVLHATTLPLLTVSAHSFGRCDVLAATRLVIWARQGWTWQHAHALRTNAIPLVEAFEWPRWVAGDCNACV